MSLNPDRRTNQIIQGEPIRDPFRKAFGAAVQWYDCVRGEIRKSVSEAIESAYHQTQASSDSHPSTSTSTWDHPSLTHCARLLQQRCPACFGGSMKGRSFKE